MYKVKRDVNGNIVRFKARLVVKGYLQQFGVDFDQTFAAVIKPMAFRVLFAIAAFLDLDIDQMDVKTALLYGLINQLVYVEMPKCKETYANREMVCKLEKLCTASGNPHVSGTKDFQHSSLKNSA